jgi:hypothetical protein
MSSLRLNVMLKYRFLLPACVPTYIIFFARVCAFETDKSMLYASSKVLLDLPCG